MRGGEGGGPAGPPPARSPDGTYDIREALRSAGPRLDRLRRPRFVVAVFLGLLGLVLLIGLLESGDRPAPSGVSLPQAVDTFVDREVGVAVGLPPGWSARRESGAVEMRARDGAGLVTVAAPAPAAQADELLRAVVTRNEEAYRRVERLGSQRLAIDGRRAEARMLVGTNRRGERIRILVAAVRGERRAYGISAFLPASQDLRLLEVERILNSLRLTR